MIIATTAACLFGATATTIVVPPRWQANSRVLLNTLKPNPITGLVEPSTAADTYAATQTELATDYTVVGQVAQQLGWLSDPQLIQLYNNSVKDGSIDYPRWVSQLLSKGAAAHVVKGSNIMEISYISSNAQSARIISNALRAAYINQALIQKSEDANSNVSFFDAQVINDMQRLNAASVEEANYQRDSGLVLEGDETDVDSERLKYLAGEYVQTASPASRGGELTANAKLAHLDETIAGAQVSLGLNNPILRGLLASRTALLGFAGHESLPAANGSLNEEVLRRRIEVQKTRVLAQREKVYKLRQLHQQTKLWRDQLNRALEKSAEMRQQSVVDDAGIIPLGETFQPPKPSFPNKPLIFSGAFILGIILGCLAALLTELLTRRVRGPEDLREFDELPLLATIVSAQTNPKKKTSNHSTLTWNN